MYNEFKLKYCELIDKFSVDLGEFNPTGMPAIHIPIIGKNYDTSLIKMAFYRKETYYWYSFKGFMEASKISSEKAFEYSTKSTTPFDYLKWTNNFGTSFWDYFFKFLSVFYKQKISLHYEKEAGYLLESFIWGETNSIERYTTTAKYEGSKYEDWEHIKNCSKIFDTAKYTLEICKPDIMIIMDWEADERWLTSGVKVDHVELYDHHLYYNVSNTDVYWLAHPRYLAPNIGFDKSIEIILNDFEIRKNNKITAHNKR